MPVDSYVNISNIEVAFTTVSLGEASAGKGVGLGATGKLDPSMMPVGIGPVTVTAKASMDINAGSFVNLYYDTGTLKMRYSDATDNTKPYNGFVLAAVPSGTNGTVYLPGNINTNLIGLTPGANYYIDKATPGGITTDVSAFSGGNIVQHAGLAISATQLITGVPPFKTTV